MPSNTSRHTRGQRSARRTQGTRRSTDPLKTPHQRAIRRLALEIQAHEGLWGWFHTGVTWRSMGSLVDPKTAVLVQSETTLKLGTRRYVPDLVVRCSKSDRILLVVEVWHTHAVTARKKADFTAAGFPWIEVRSWHVISHFRKRPLPVLDWGGPGFPVGPEQYALFEAGPASSNFHRRVSSVVNERTIPPSQKFDRGRYSYTETTTVSLPLLADIGTILLTP